MTGKQTNKQTAEKTPQKADFAMKQTNICRISGDIINNIIQSLVVASSVMVQFKEIPLLESLLII